MDYKHAKELFVSDMEGATVWDVNVVSAVALVSLIRWTWLDILLGSLLTVCLRMRFD